MTSELLPILDLRVADAAAAIGRLRERLSPRGDILSAASQAKTMEVFGAALTPQEVVRQVCHDVERHGFRSVQEYTRRFDGIELSENTLRVGTAELAAAHQGIEPSYLRAVRAVRDQVWEFQAAIRHQDKLHQSPTGVTIQQRYRPLRRVGICVPGGAAAYPSTVLMTVVPALVAGVDEIVVVAPPTRWGADNPTIRAVCHELGVREVYRVGGAQAVAAMAHGVEGLAAVDKIVGPGNLFVALAKQQVFGTVDIDALAGPSEVVVIADGSGNDEHLAMDLLAQAEHAPGSSILITWEPELPSRLLNVLERQLSILPREEQTRHSLREYSAILLVHDPTQACVIADQIAPEHLHLAIREPRTWAESIRNAGAIFVGHHTPVALGDYISGPSHVLPTGGTARWASGLSVNSFLRNHAVVEYSLNALEVAALPVTTMAKSEGLAAHAASVQVRVPTHGPTS